MLPTEDNAHLAEARDLLIGQYRGKVNIDGLIQVLAARTQALEGDVWSVIGSQLLTRAFPAGTAQGQLDGPPDVALLQVADLVGAPAGLWTTRQLVLLVGLWILARKSQGRSEDELAILEALNSANVSYLEAFPAAFESHITDLSDGRLAEPIAEAVRLAKAAGVAWTFGWSTEDPDVVYWGDAATGAQGSGLNDAVAGGDVVGLLSAIGG